MGLVPDVLVAVVVVGIAALARAPVAVAAALAGVLVAVPVVLEGARRRATEVVQRLVRMDVLTHARLALAPAQAAAEPVVAGAILLVVVDRRSCG